MVNWFHEHCKCKEEEQRMRHRANVAQQIRKEEEAAQQAQWELLEERRIRWRANLSKKMKQEEEAAERDRMSRHLREAYKLRMRYKRNFVENVIFQFASCLGIEQGYSVFLEAKKDAKAIRANNKNITEVSY